MNSLLKDEGRKEVTSPGTVTALLNEWTGGDKEALGCLMELVYPEVHGFAMGQLRGEHPGQRPRPTALVNEVYLQLVHGTEMSFINRAMFYKLVKVIIRHILIARARNRGAVKRGGHLPHISLQEIMTVKERSLDPDLKFALDEALKHLETADPSMSTVSRLHFFWGFHFTEIALIMKLSKSTVRKKWKTAKIWLEKDLRNRHARGYGRGHYGISAAPSSVF